MTTKVTVRDVILIWLAKITKDEWLTKTDDELADSLWGDLQAWAADTVPGKYVRPQSKGGQ